MKVSRQYNAAIDALLKSDEPAIVYKVRKLILLDEDSVSLNSLEKQIRHCARVTSLLQGRDEDGHIRGCRNVYDKWQGAHWVLASLADLGYPGGDESLYPLRNDVLDYWLSERYCKEFAADSSKDVYRGVGVPVIEGRHRRCASQQGNALYFLSKLGLGDERLDQLVRLLLRWQWTDGGWNCDKTPAANSSSFMETILPLRGLALYGSEKGNTEATLAAQRAAEVFLRRRLLWRISDGTIIHKEFCRLHYPLYWHYDFLHGLKVLAESGFAADTRCNDALDLLERMQLKDGGWASEGRYYKSVSQRDIVLNADYVDWGGTSAKRMNPWVTADALFVLRAAGRLG